MSKITQSTAISTLDASLRSSKVEDTSGIFGDDFQPEPKRSIVVTDMEHGKIDAAIDFRTRQKS